MRTAVMISISSSSSPTMPAPRYCPRLSRK
jgi:hypothetical protein